MGDQLKGGISEQLVEAAANLVVASNKIVAFTGTGIASSTQTQQVKASVNLGEDTFPKFQGDPAARKRGWQLWTMFHMIETSQPNAVHYAIAELLKLGKLECVITQNVDGLHQKTGIPDDKLVELHGSLRWLKCINCGQRYHIIDIAKKLAEGQSEESVCTDCGGKLKAATVSFGEPPLTEEVSKAERFSRNCDLFMLLGSSLMIYPAAYMPVYAVESGAKLMIINTGTSHIDDKADVFIQGDVGKALSAIMDRVRNKAGAS
ncbi:MAG: Sir2 family NAD-dependent protein deacetylase [Dehalococcoidia bacterium]